MNRGTVARLCPGCHLGPGRVLARIEFDPPLPGAKRDALAAVPYQAAARVLIQVSQRVWESKGLSGFAATDELGEVWHTTHRQSAEPGILAAYLRGDRARAPVPRLLDRARDGMNRLFPGVSDRFEQQCLKSWHDDPWSRGSQVLPGALHPSQVFALGLREGRVHFAGSHLCANESAGWMDAALESGERVALEVHLAP